MLEYINEYMKSLNLSFNEDLLNNTQDVSILDYVIMSMKEFESIENIKILGYKVIEDQARIDLNYHNININFKKKSLKDLKIPKHKMVAKTRCDEVIFDIEIRTNLHYEVIKKSILIPVLDEEAGYYILGSKCWTPIYQLSDGTTYSNRGSVVMKARMPIYIYHTKNLEIADINGDNYNASSFSYALKSKQPKGISVKSKIKFVNPMLIFSAKMGLPRAIEFFGFKDIIEIVEEVDDDDNWYLYFKLDNLFIKVPKDLFNEHKFIRNMVCMLKFLGNRDFPIKKRVLENKEYWICRIGCIGSAKDSNLLTFREKGYTNLLMIERLLNNVTLNNLRLPRVMKKNVYYILRWLIEEFDDLKSRSNIDLKYKRLRRNEYIVDSSLGKKISTSINKLLEKLNKSRMNDIETLEELFNFPSNIVLTGLKNLGDLVKSDDQVGDLTWLSNIAYSAKGPNSLGENSSKVISEKYKDIHPSYYTRIDLYSTSSSDPGMSGSLTPFVKLYNGLFFSNEQEPYSKHFELLKIRENYLRDSSRNVNMAFIETLANIHNAEEYLQYIEENGDGFEKELEYEKLEIVEKEISETKSDIKYEYNYDLGESEE